MATSKLLGITYDPSNSNCIYIGNVKQVSSYLAADESLWEDLLDIIVSEKKNTKELAFVFKRDSERMRNLYARWNEHSL